MQITQQGLYRRRSGIFTHAVYQVVRLDDYEVVYTVYSHNNTEFTMAAREFAETFIALTADEVLKETGGIF